MNILYGVPSEGMGHATRSKVVVDYLIQNGHQVIIVTSGHAFQFFKKIYGNCVHEIRGFHFAFENEVVSIKETVSLTLRNAPQSILNNLNEYKNLFAHYKFNLVVSDFESFTFFYAKLTRTTLISIDNMQIIDRAKLNINIPQAQLSMAKLSKKIVSLKVPRANHYFITSFFYPKIIKKNTSYVAPILRNEIIHAKTIVRNHIVVYQKSVSEQKLIKILNSFMNENFIVYGFNKDVQIGNVISKTFSEQGFIKDFSEAKAVLANGGFSFISEAIYLQKPIFTVPIEKQFEQFVNASYVEQLNYGMHATHFTIENLKKFLLALPHYQNALNDYKQHGNEILFASIDEILQQIENAK